jgi:small subunit ribosomal protein S17
MADETPEETTAEETPAVAAEETPAAAPAEATPAAPAAEAAPAAPPATPKERKAVSRARRGQRRLGTPEERTAAKKAKAVARSRRRKQEREKKAALPNGEGTPKPDHGPGRAKTRLGIVTSDKADKTITVQTDAARRHRRYEKIVRSTSKLHAHDEANDAKTGDRVRVVECRPMSATKRWKLDEVLERAK